MNDKQFNQMMTALLEMENRVLNEMEKNKIETRTDIQVVKTEVQEVKTTLNTRFNQLEKELLNDQDDFETVVTDHVETKEKEVRAEINYLKKRIKNLEDRLSS